MPGRFKYELLAKYPHMKPADVEIWQRFIKANADFFDTVDYDVLVGEGAPFDTTLNNLEGQDVGALYLKKIDVVGYKGGDTWLVEVKPNAQLTALGQVAAYDELYKQEFKPTGKIINAVLTDQINPDILNVAGKWDIVILKA